MKVLFAGDYCLYDRAAKMSYEELNQALSMVKGVVSGCDYAIVNLECSVFDTQKHPIKKIGSALHTDSNALRVLKENGFKCLALANNHFADFGNDAVKESFNLIDSYGFDRIGAGMTIEEARRTLFVEVCGVRLAVINCCEHEFTIADTLDAGCNPLDPIEQYKAIVNARKEAEYVVVMVHGGSEHYQLPTPRMQKTYRFFVDAGADVVVNCHQHCYSGYEIYHGKHIFYGLGNFFFDWTKMRDDIWNEGYLLKFDFSEGGSFELIPYLQCNDKAEIRLLSADEEMTFKAKIQDLNKVIMDEGLLESCFSQWVEKSTKDYLWAFHKPIPRWKRYLKRLGVIDRSNHHVWDSHLNSNMLITLLSYIRCESHRDIFLELLKRRMG